MPRYTQPRKTWRYTNNFKVEAVKLSYQEGIHVKQGKAWAREQLFLTISENCSLTRFFPD